MAARPVTCPSAETLRDFVLAKLDPLLAEAVVSHLESCAVCRATVEAQQDDSFLGRVRAAHVSHHTRVPYKSLSGVARSLKALSGDPDIYAHALLEHLGPYRGMLYFHLLLGRMRNLVAEPPDSQVV